MSRKKIVNLSLSLYVGLILIFSFVFFILWLINPSNFVINNELNHRLPTDFDEINNSLEYEEKNRLTDYTDYLEYIRVEYLRLNIKIKMLKSAVMNYSDEIIEMKDKEYNEQRIDYENEILDSLVTKLNEKIFEKEELIKEYGYGTKYHKSDYDLIISGVNLDIAELNLEIASEELNFYLSLENINEYDSMISDNIIKISELQKLMFTYEEDVLQTKRNIAKKWEDIKYTRIKKMSFWDFVYFSFITATTIGYGDIVPNTTTIRMLVVFESALCIILLGTALAHINLTAIKNPLEST